MLAFLATFVASLLILIVWDPLKYRQNPQTPLARMIAGIRTRIVDEPRKIFLKWSTRFNAAGLLILGWIQVDPTSVLYVWGLMPDAVNELIPPRYLRIVGLVLFGLGMLSTLVKQKKLGGAPDAK